MSKYILALLCIALLSTGTNGCSTDEDCFLNGVCTNGNCACDPGWTGISLSINYNFFYPISLLYFININVLILFTGSNCSTLAFQPAPIIGAYGYSPNITSWGGVPVLVNGVYHLLVTEIVDGCGLCTWGSNSRVIHATSSTLLGPYTYQNEALPIWAHNPHVCDSSLFFLFHFSHMT